MTAPARIAVLVALALVLTGCGGDDAPEQPEPTPAPEEQGEPEAAPAEVEEEGAEAISTEPLRSVRVRVYFPSADGTMLVGEEREIFDTAAPEDRAKQILSDLLSGPERDDAIAAMPRGVRLRQVYVLPDGTGYADFSRELSDLIAGGTSEELTTVFAVVNSVVLNVREIRRLGILVDGEEIDTLAGHLDLRRPLAPRTDLIRESAG